MILTVSFPNTLTSEALLQQKNIPCLSRIAEKFEVVFQSPFSDVVGCVSEWKMKEIDERVPANAGGKYTHYSSSLITLQAIDKDRYFIKDLSLFDTYVGWCSVVDDGVLCSSGSLWSDEVDDIGR